jgi:mono/diheme cytochrome c family protein/plastocyanin
MTDQPGQPPEQRLPVPREPADVAPAERFTAPAQAHSMGLTPERAAKIVRQSGNSRWVAFLAVTVVTIFVIGYFFYELGVPGVPDSSRMEKETAAQQVTDVQRGYKLFQANCSRCHGVQGEGGIGPKLNDQAKLLTHLTPQYLATVLTVGGRYVCGNPSSQMLAWLEPKGPLNYRQVEELISFLRAPNTLTYTAIDSTTGAESQATGWRDVNYVMPAGATPVPDCWVNGLPGAGGSPAPSASASAAPSAAPGGTVVTLELTAQGVKYDKVSLEAPANTPFKIKFTNNDAGMPHNVQILRDGVSVWQGDIFSGVDVRTYDVPALTAGSYTFICTVHPTMKGTLDIK